MNDKQNFIEDNIVMLSRQTIDEFLKQDSPGDLIALYTFYYYTAKWQETNQPRATTAYAAKGLKWSRERIIKTKKLLITIGLITEIRDLDAKTKQVKGWYIKLNYIWSKNHTEVNPQAGLTHTQENAHTNALSDININSLNVIKKKTPPDSNQRLFIDLYCKAYEKHFKTKPFLNEVTGKINIPGKEIKAFQRILKKYGIEKIKSWFEPDQDGDALLFVDERIIGDKWAQVKCFYPTVLEGLIESVSFKAKQEAK